MTDWTKTPGDLYDRVVEALKSRPTRNLSTSAGFAAAYRDTREALAPLGVTLTDSQVQRLHWSDDLRTLWDCAEYVTERHFARHGLKAVWPVRGDDVRLITRRRAA